MNTRIPRLAVIVLVPLLVGVGAMGTVAAQDASPVCRPQ